jgi:hypothetical protein
MNSRVTIKDIVSMLLIIISFGTTGIMIMNEDYRYAIIALSFAAVCVLIGFAVIIVEDGDKILDLSNPSLRNPRKSGSDRRVTYISGLTPRMMGEKSKSNSKNKSSRDDLYLGESNGDDFYESVGNMRVYKRGEEIDYHNSEED